MPKRKQAIKTPSSASENDSHSAIPPRAVAQESDWFRRALLLAVTALLVARPLVAGEDPGMTGPRADTSNLVLTTAWMLVAVGWAVWRYRSRSSQWRVGPVELSLLVAVLFVLLSAGVAARYQRPAWLMTWEWFTFLLALFLIRQLAVTAADQRCVVAALLANVISLSAVACYQFHSQRPYLLDAQQREIAKLQSQVEREEARTDSIAGAVGGGLVATGWRRLRSASILETQSQPELAQRQGDRQQLADNPSVPGTFDSAGAFAGYVTLLLPSLAILAWMRWRGQRDDWKTWATLACLLLGLYGLWLTRSFGAILGLVLATVLAAAIAARRRLCSRRAIALSGFAAIIVGAAILVRQSGMMNDSRIRSRLDYWRTTWVMVEESPWLGVGPGNFDRQYPEKATTPHWKPPHEPHNFFLEVWATSGFFAIAALLAALIAFIGAVLRRAPRDPNEGEQSEEPDDKRSPSERKDFYVAGMLGLFFGYVLGETSQSTGAVMAGNESFSSDSIVSRAFVACFRSLAWFAAFGLLERARSTNRQRVIGLTVGVLALLFCLCVSGSIASSSIAQPMWCVVGLTLCGLRTQPQTKRETSWLGRVIALPILGALALIYLITFTLPIVESQRMAARAERARNTGRVSGKSFGEHFKMRVVDPLEAAVKLDPTSSRLRQQLSLRSQHLWLWLLIAERQRHEAQKFYSTQASLMLAEAIRIDPNNYRLYVQNAELNHAIADSPLQTNQEAARHALRLELHCAAARNLNLAVKLDKTNPRNHFLLARAYLKILKSFNDWRPATAAAAFQRLNAATASLLSLMELNPVSPRDNPNLAANAIRRRIVDQVRASAQRAVELDAVSHPSRKLRAPERARAERWKEI